MGRLPQQGSHSRAPMGAPIHFLAPQRLYIGVTPSALQIPKMPSVGVVSVYLTAAKTSQAMMFLCILLQSPAAQKARRPTGGARRRHP